MSVRVLLAEDNESLAQMLGKFLSSMALEVHFAATGVEALNILSSREIDLLLLDLRLPELSGVELLQKLRKMSQFAMLPVIIMTGVYKEERFVEAARKLGVRHYLQKPFSRDSFQQAIQATLTDIQSRRSQPLLELLAHIYRNKRSGLLSIDNAPPIHVIKGEPYSFLSEEREEFAQSLLARGRIDSEDVALFVTSRSERIFFTQTGLLTYDELVEESRIFLAKCIVDGLERKATAQFSDGFVPPELPLVPVTIPCLLYDTARSHPGRHDSDRFTMCYEKSYPARTSLFYRIANLTIMRKEDIELLGYINGKNTFADIAAACVDKKGAAAFCHYLLTFGMIAMHDAPTVEAVPDFTQKHLLNRPIEEDRSDEHAVGFDDLVEELSESVEIAVGEDGMAAPLSSTEIDFEQTVQRDNAFIKDKNYYEIFGLTPGTFSFNALKEAYFAKTRQYSPERFMELSGATQTMAQDILAVFANAYNTLSSVVAKERYDEILNANKVGVAGKQDDKLQAQIQFQSGKVFLEMGEYENAEKSIQDAYTLEPENPMHCAFLAWTIYRNPANRNSRSAIEKARSLLNRSLQLDKSAEAYAFRGWMLLDEGRDGLAEGEFQKALKINPNELNSRKGLSLINEKKEAQNKGFFRKFFN
jgi:DNA-binding response OmpR family regulator/tetratricopeptide (TPR) repeat protein